MAVSFQKTYRPDIEQLLRPYAQSLSEKDRRRCAALAAITLGQGGIRSIAQVLACDPHTGKDGRQERKQLPEDPAGRRVRKPGGGRTKTAVTHADLIQQGQDTIQDRIAGAPMRQDVVWTDVTPHEMSPSLREHAVGAGPRIVRRLLAGLGGARRGRAAARCAVAPSGPVHASVSRGGHPGLAHGCQEESIRGHALAGWQGLLPTGPQSV